MKLLKIRLITAICLAGCLCACGEGGAGGSVASTPAPLPAPTPTPSPTPSPQPAQTFSGTGGSALAITTASQTLTPSVLSAGPLPQNLGSNANALVIARDASGGYAITVRMLEGNGAFAGEAVTKQFSFPITSRTGTSADQTSSEFSSPATGGGTWSATLQTDLAAPGKGRSHVNFATLIACNLVGGTGCAPDEFASAFLVFGSATPLSAIPPSGSASYSGRFSLPAPVGNDIADGFIGLSVNFASRNVTGTLSDVAIAVDVGFTGAISRIPDFAITGQLAANGLLSGNLTPGAGSDFAGGSWAGNFFGPNASEIGGTIMLPTKPGAVDPYYAGTFSAAKQ